MSDKTIILAGYSGHGFVVAEAALSCGMNLKYYSEIKRSEINPFDLTYIGNECDAGFSGWHEPHDFILGIGDNKIRQKAAGSILEKGMQLLNVIHASASVSDKITIGFGNLIARNASVNPLATIGSYCILNTGSIIEHECFLEDAVHIAPGAVLAGNVYIGERTFIGANSVVKEGIKIGKDVIIGAGSVILKDIPDGKKAAGNPAREI